MTRQQWLIAGGIALLVLVAAAAFGLSSALFPKRAAEQAAAAEAKEEAEAADDLCASTATYQRLKEQLFAEAARVRREGSPNLDLVAAQAVVRMEQPLLKSRDEALGVTVCSGRFVLELPPGAERGFGGERRLVADIEYAAQPAADGSGLVWRMRGAEPIVYKLAAFDLAAAPQLAPEPLPDNAAEPLPLPVPPVDVAPPPPALPVDAPPPPRPSARPSFDCRDAGTRSELRVCDSPELAALDRRMAAAYEDALAVADDRGRRRLARTRDRFLAYRERCGSDACIADAYRGRMLEIRDIVEER